MIQWFRDKLPISPPSSPRLLSASRQTEGIFPSPTPLGLSEKPGFSQDSHWLLHKPSPPGAGFPLPVPGPPRSAQPDQAHPPCSPGQVPHPSPPPRQLSSRSEILPVFPHTAPLRERRSAPRLRTGAPRAARTRQSQQAGAPLTLSAREARSCCGGSSGCASLPLPPGHRRGRRSASGGVPASPGPAPLHLVPPSARRNPVSCLDPEAAFTAQQQHVTRRTCHVRCVNGRGHQRSESSPTDLGLPWRRDVCTAGRH